MTSVERVELQDEGERGRAVSQVLVFMRIKWGNVLVFFAISN